MNAVKSTPSPKAPVSGATAPSVRPVSRTISCLSCCASSITVLAIACACSGSTPRILLKMATKSSCVTAPLSQCTRSSDWQSTSDVRLCGGLWEIQRMA
eukprot:1152020-Prymnesium_polylepis.2